MRMTAKLSLLLAFALLGCSRNASAPAASQPGPATKAAAPAPPPAAVQAPDFEFEPLTQQHVDLYLAVMREAVEKYKNLPAEDKKVLEDEKRYYAHLKSGWHPSPTSQEQALFTRADQLHHLDYDIAQQKGQRELYSAIASAVEGMVGPHKCSDSDCGEGEPEDDPALRKKQLEDDKKRKAIIRQDLALLKPHEKEIDNMVKTMRF